MNRAFLIARQEFIKYVTRRGFFISILMFPLWIVVVTLIPQWTAGGDSPRILTVVDQTGAGDSMTGTLCARLACIGLIVAGITGLKVVT